MSKPFNACLLSSSKEILRLVVSIVIFSCAAALCSSSIEVASRRWCFSLPSTLSVGIDLGTTYSLVSVVDGGKPRLLSVDGRFTVPSVVHYGRDGHSTVGVKALENFQLDVPNTFASVKRLIGRTIEDARLTKDDKVFGRKLVGIPSKGNNGQSASFSALRCPNLNKDLSPEEISAKILQKLIDSASSYYNGTKVTNAVITVPAYFTPQQSAATELAGKLAGLQKIKLLKEPEAAAMAYGLLQERPQLVLVVDLGGGTFDVSVLEVGAGLVEVIATSGDGHLGGDDFDQLLVDWVLSTSGHFTAEQAQALRTKPRFMRNVTEAAVKAKLQLTKSASANISFFDPLIKQEVSLEIGRRKFESLSKTLLGRLLRPIREVSLMAGINLPGESGQVGIKEDITTSEFLGEATESLEEDYDLGLHGLPSLKMMESQQKLGRQGSKDKKKLKQSANRELRRLQRTSSDPSLSLFPSGQMLDDVILVGGATRMPCVVKLIRILTGIDPKRHVNPDEAICLGAGVMAGVLDGKIDGFQVMSPLQAALFRALLEEKKKGNKFFDVDKVSNSTADLPGAKAGGVKEYASNNYNYNDDDDEEEEIMNALAVQQMQSLERSQEGLPKDHINRSIPNKMPPNERTNLSLFKKRSQKL